MRKPAGALTVFSAQRRILQAWVAAGSTPQKLVLRARIVLLAAQGVANRQIAQRLRTSRPTVILWRRRFAAGGPAALTKDAPGRGRKPAIAPEKVKADPRGDASHDAPRATRWSVRTMAAAQGVSAATVQRIWKAQGLAPGRRVARKSRQNKALSAPSAVAEADRAMPIRPKQEGKSISDTRATERRSEGGRSMEPHEDRDTQVVGRPAWESYPNYGARYLFLLALRNGWPKFWRSLNAGWRSGEPGWLDRWAREHNVMNEGKHISNRWLLDVVKSTLEYWTDSPDSPDATLQRGCPWFRYPADRFQPFPEFQPVLTDARPILTPLVADVPAQIAASQQCPIGDDSAGKAAIAGVRRLFSVEPIKQCGRRLFMQFKQQWAQYSRKYQRNAEFDRITPQIQAHARWTMQRMRGDCLEEVARMEPNSSFLSVERRANRLETIARQVRRFMREAELRLPPWQREPRQRSARRSPRA